MPAPGDSSGDSHWADDVEKDVHASMGSTEVGSAVQKCPLKDWEPAAEVGELPAWTPQAKTNDVDWECRANIPSEEESDASAPPGDDRPNEEQAEEGQGQEDAES